MSGNLEGYLEGPSSLNSGFDMSTMAAARAEHRYTQKLLLEAACKQCC